MELWFRFKSMLRNLLQKRRVEMHLDDELRGYVQQVVDELVGQGVPEADARRRAMAEFGGVEQVKQSVRDGRAGTAVELVLQDVRYGLRQLRRNPAFTVTAVLMTGLGIGATTAIFSAVYSLILRPLPYYESSRIVSWSGPDGAPVLDPDFVAARGRTKSFKQLAGFHMYSADILTGIGDPVRVRRAAVTANFFPVLGMVPALGRNFYADEDWSGGANVLMLSDSLWRNKFGADAKAVGRVVRMNGIDYTIIGVLPRHFSFPSSSLEPDIYGSAMLDRSTVVDPAAPIWGIQTVARLRPGVTAQQAQAEMQAFSQTRLQDYPPELADWARNRKMTVETLQRHLTGDNRKPLYILLACVAAVLLISCANVTNLQLARAVSRRHETAVRGAMGASRMRLMRQFLTESLLLSAMAAAVGLGIAWLVTVMVQRTGTPGDAEMPSRMTQMLRLPFGKLSATIQIDGWVLAFTVGLALATTLLSGLAPAFSGTRASLRGALASAGTRMSSGREHRFLRQSLLVSEVALALVLLACAGLLVRSFARVMSYDSGFEASNMLTGTVTLHTGVSSLRGPTTAWSEGRAKGFMDQVMVRLKALPGVQVAALTTALPLDFPGSAAVAYDGVPIPPQGKWLNSAVTAITPQYFQAVETPLLKGRVFASTDNETAPRVAIVNMAFARRFFAGDAVGKRFKVNDGSHGEEFIPLTIVGEVDDVRHGGLETDPEPELFRPLAQAPSVFSLKLVLRTSAEPALLANAMRKAVVAVDSQVPVFDVQTMEQRVSDLVAQRRLIMLLIVCFALLAVILSAVGVYGVFTYSVTQRAHEMGIRLALGSSRMGVLRLVMSQAAQLIALGGVIGFTAALALSRLLASLLVGITPHDPVSFLGAWVLMTVVALLASAVPAAQAARTDLIATLHSE
jgi:predicted permease